MARRKLPGFSAYAVVGTLTVAFVGGVTVVGALRSEDRREVARYQAWHLDGPPCATISSAQALGRARKRFVVEDTTVARENGHLTCFEIKDHGGHGPGDIRTCHLLTPGALAVITRTRTFGFDPGPGRSAALFIAQAGVSCVMGVNARLFSSAAERPYD